MTKVVITEELKKILKNFLEKNRPAELINTYLCFIEHKFHLEPVLFPKENKTCGKSRKSIPMLGVLVDALFVKPPPQVEHGV